MEVDSQWQDWEGTDHWSWAETPGTAEEVADPSDEDFAEEMQSFRVLVDGWNPGPSLEEEGLPTG